MSHNRCVSFFLWEPLGIWFLKASFLPHERRGSTLGSTRPRPREGHLITSLGLAWRSEGEICRGWKVSWAQQKQVKHMKKIVVPPTRMWKMGVYTPSFLSFGGYFFHFYDCGRTDKKPVMICWCNCGKAYPTCRSSSDMISAMLYIDFFSKGLV